MTICSKASNEDVLPTFHAQQHVKGRSSAWHEQQHVEYMTAYPGVVLLQQCNDLGLACHCMVRQLQAYLGVMSPACDIKRSLATP